MNTLFTDVLKAFVVGGLICAIGQVLIDYTKLTPARILVGYVVAGVILGGGALLGMFDYYPTATQHAVIEIEGYDKSLLKDEGELIATKTGKDGKEKDLAFYVTNMWEAGYKNPKIVYKAMAY